MGFKTFYLAEKVSQKEIKDLTNIISGVANKEITNGEKRDNGVFFSLFSFGSWASFSSKLKEEMAEHKWEDESPSAVELKFVRGKMVLFARYAKSVASFYITDKKDQEPEYEIDSDK